MKLKITPKQQSFNKKQKNVAKHLRITKKTYGEEKDAHLKKADKLLTKYGW